MLAVHKSVRIRAFYEDEVWLLFIEIMDNLSWIFQMTTVES